MKTLILSIATIANCFLFNTSTAQRNICVFCAVNIAIQPNWGPTGYDWVNYYYLPDIDSYYDVQQHQFIYQEHGAWKTAGSLPLRYATFNLYHAYKVVINDETPYLQHESNKIKYSVFKGQHNQVAIRDSHGPNYAEAKRAEHSRSALVLGNDKSKSQHIDDDHHKIMAER